MITEATKTKIDIIQAYWDGVGHLSHSAFESFLQSPRHFIEYKLRKKETTPAMKFGSAFHCLVLEPDEFEDRYLVKDITEPSTDAGKAFCKAILDGKSEVDAFLEAGYKQGKDLLNSAVSKLNTYSDYLGVMQSLKGRELITQSDYNLAKEMKEAVYSNDASRYVLDRIDTTEMMITWENGGYKWRGAQDGRGENIVLDLKTIADASPKKVERELLYDGLLFTSTGKYVRQAAHYTKGNKEPKGTQYHLVAIDKKCNISTFLIKDEAINTAWNDIGNLIKRFKICLFNDEWNKSYDFWKKTGIYEV